MAEINTSDLEEALKKIKEGVIPTFDSIEKELKSFKKGLKDTQPSMNTFKEILSGSASKLDDLREIAEKFDRQIEEASESVDGLSGELDKAAIQAQKSEVMKQAAWSNTKKTLANFAVGVGGVAMTMLNGAMDFVSGLQSGKEGTQLATDAAKATAKVLSQATEEIGKLAQSIGMLMAVLPVGRILKLAGVLLSAAGIIAEEVTPQLSELAQKGIQILGDEIEKTKKNFREISQAGAFFGNGMTEMRQIAYDAGIDIGILGDVVKRSTRQLGEMGLGINESIKRFAKINQEIRNSQLAIQFRRLGLDTEAYGEAAIEAASMLQSSGQLRGMTDTQVANYTLQYVKNLKILQEITGEDAKKKMEVARRQSMEADLYAKAMAQGGPEAVDRLRNVLATVPDALKTGALEFLSTGGEAIVDAATNVAMVENPKLYDYFQSLQDGVTAVGKSGEEVMLASLESLKAAGQYSIQFTEDMGVIATAGRLTKDGLLTGVGEIQSALIDIGTRLGGQDVQQAADELNKTIAGRGDILGQHINELDEKAVTLRNILGQQIEPTLTGWASTLNEGFNLAKQLNDVLRTATEGLAAKKEENAPKPGFFERIFSSDYSKNVSTAVSPPVLWGPSAGKAKGGVSTGPISGYHELLHGTEAVVPLPDNKSIPVSLDTGSLSQSIERNNNLLTDIVRVLKEGNNNTSVIARNVA